MRNPSSSDPAAPGLSSGAIVCALAAVASRTSDAMQRIGAGGWYSCRGWPAWATDPRRRCQGHADAVSTVVAIAHSCRRGRFTEAANRRAVLC